MDVRLNQMLVAEDKFMASVLVNRAKKLKAFIKIFSFKLHLIAGNQIPDQVA